MNSTQTQTTSATVIALAAGYLAGAGGLSATDWTSLLTAAAAIGAIVWPVVATRVQALKDTVGKSGAVVVTSAASANALPNNPNVVSADTVAVVNKAP